MWKQCAFDTAEKKPFPRYLALAVLTMSLIAVPLPARAAGADDAAPADQGQTDDLSGMPLEQLLNVKIYSASRFLQNISEAPASVTIVSSDEIRRQGYRTLADILRTVRGVYVTYDRNYSYVGVRGFLRPGDYNGRILLLVNGHRLNDTIYEQALIGTESPIDVSLFERVEVIRGPSSSLYGTSAFFAVVNIVTRTASAADGTELELEAGSQATGRARATLGGTTRGGYEGLFSVSSYRSDGNSRIYYPAFDTPPSSDGYAVNADGDRSTSVFMTGGRGSLHAQAAFGSRTKHVPTASFDTLFNDNRTKTADTRGFADLQYSHAFDARTSLELRGSYDQYDYSGWYAYDTGMFHDAGRGAWVTTQASAVRQYSRHALTVGAEFLHNFRDNQSASDETGVVLDDRRASNTAALFVEDEVRVSSRLLVNGGLRWDEYYGIFGGTLNPRVGVIVTPATGATVKALYGRAFRAPNPFELYYDQNAISAALKPERIQTWELAWEQRVTPRLQTSVSAFRSRVSGLITQSEGSSDTIDGLYYRNLDNVTADGVELELQGELPGRIRTRVAHAFQSASRDAGVRSISNSPGMLSTFVADAPLPWFSDTFLAFNGYYIGQRRRVLSGDVPSAFVGNLSLTRRPARGIGVGVTVYNLLNADYSDPGSLEHRQELLPQDGRTVALRLNWRF